MELASEGPVSAAAPARAELVPADERADEQRGTHSGSGTAPSQPGASTSCATPSVPAEGTFFY